MTTPSYGSMGHLEALAARRDAEDEAFRRGQERKADGWHVYHICGGILRELTHSEQQALCVVCGQWCVIRIESNRSGPLQGMGR